MGRRVGSKGRTKANRMKSTVGFLFVDGVHLRDLFLWIFHHIPIALQGPASMMPGQNGMTPNNFSLAYAPSNSYF